MNPTEQSLVKDGEQVINKDPNGAWAAVRTADGKAIMRVKAGAQVSEQPLTDEQLKSMGAAQAAMSAASSPAVSALKNVSKIEAVAGVAVSAVAAASAATGIFSKYFKKL